MTPSRYDKLYNDPTFVVTEAEIEMMAKETMDAANGDIDTAIEGVTVAVAESQDLMKFNTFMRVIAYLKNLKEPTVGN